MSNNAVIRRKHFDAIGPAIPSPSQASWGTGVRLEGEQLAGEGRAGPGPCGHPGRASSAQSTGRPDGASPGAVTRYEDTDRELGWGEIGCEQRL